jgi:NADPH-dependent ferric siderophore reductase
VVVWVGCEADSAREVRRNLGLSPRSVYTRAHWKDDVADDSDEETG